MVLAGGVKLLKLFGGISLLLAMCCTAVKGQSEGITAAKSKLLPAQVDCNRLFPGASTLLRIRAVKESDAMALDLQPLRKDFELIRHSSVNEEWSASRNLAARTVWIVELKPKRLGELTIPSLRLGPHLTRPVDLSVERQGPEELAELQRQVFIEVTSEPPQAYVQSQIFYTVRMYYSDQLIQGTLSEPVFPGAFSQQIGSSKSRDEQRVGIDYRVTERRFVVFPEHSGVFTIPALQFQGEVAYQGIQTETQSTRRMRCRAPLSFATEAITLDVLPRPSHYREPYWLPATALTIEDKWLNRPEPLRVGTPLLRQITVAAAGLDQAKLPELKFTDIEGVRVYTELAETRSELNASQGFTSYWQQTVTMIPTRSGYFTMPEIRIPWWDTSSNQARVSKLAAESFYAQPLPAVMGEATGLAGQLITPERLLIALTVALVLLTVSSAISPAFAAAKPWAALQALLQLRIACVSNNAGAAALALNAWGAALWPNNPPRSLPALAQRLLADARPLHELDRLLYQPTDQGQPWRGGRALWQTLRADWRQQTQLGSKIWLTPLYPIRC